MVSDENYRLKVTIGTMFSSDQTVSGLDIPATHPSQSLDGTKHAEAVPGDAMRVDTFPDAI